MDKLKIVIVNTTDIKGGAARAAFRLHSGLRGIHTNSNYYVQYQHSKDRYTISEASNPKKLVNLIRPSIDSIPLHFYPQKKDTFFSLCWVPRVFDQSARYLSSYDIVHLHWTCNAFIPINELKHYNRPIVWTLHDMWPFTGGCHYSGACTKYKSKCGKCEQLNSKSERDLSRWTWHRKSKAFDNLNLTVVTPSQWMACCARESSLFKNKRIEVIPNGINTSVYKPVRKKLARSILNLPDSKKLILFVAFDSTSDKRKGFDLLNQALIQNKNLSPQKNALIILGPRPKGPAPI
ncbi:glycosyltransferase, partial [Desulfoluna spongiiphila]